MVLYGRDVDMNNVLLQARRYPMMSERQVVLVKEAQDIRDLPREEGQDLLSKYLEQPTPSTVLVFAHKQKSIDTRKKLGKALDKKAVLVNSKKLFDNQVPTWIDNYIRDKGHASTHKAVAMLAEFLGNDLSKISNELDKIFLNYEGKVDVTEELVEKYIGISKDYNVFELQKALATRDVLKANRIILHFEKDLKRNPIIPMIAVLYGFFTKLLIANQEGAMTENALKDILKVNYYAAKDYAMAMRNYPLAKVEKAIHFIHQADLRTKGIESGSMNDGDIMREMVFKILHV